MRSPRAFAGGLAMLVGVPLALATAAVFGDGAEDVLHLALATSFALLAFAVFDFRLPSWFNRAAFVATATLAAIFLLQGVADLLHAATMQHIAYDVLGQRLEKLLGYAFLLWCAAMLLRDSAGAMKILGAIVLAAIVCVEIYTVVAAQTGHAAPGALKLVNLPLFLWLLLEGLQPRRS